MSNFIIFKHMHICNLPLYNRYKKRFCVITLCSKSFTMNLDKCLRKQKRHQCSDHLCSLKKPFRVLLSLMVTVRELVVTSVTRMFSTLPRDGLHLTSSESSSSRVGEGLSKKYGFSICGRLGLWLILGWCLKCAGAR